MTGSPHLIYRNQAYILVLNVLLEDVVVKAVLPQFLTCLIFCCCHLLLALMICPPLRQWAELAKSNI